MKFINKREWFIWLATLIYIGVMALVALMVNQASRSAFVDAPFPFTMTHSAESFFFVMVESLALIAIVIVGSVLIARSERKRLTLEEDLKHLNQQAQWTKKLGIDKKTIEGIIEGSPIPTFVINREHKVILWNRACSELTGYNSSEMIGTDKHYMPYYSEKRPIIADLIVDKNIEGLEKYYGGKNVNKSPVIKDAYEARDFFKNLGGKNRYLYFLAAPVYDENGAIIAAIETLQDVTKEEEMARHLKEHAESLANKISELTALRTEMEEINKHLQSILESSPDRIAAISKDGIISYMSHGSWAEDKQMEGGHFIEHVVPEYKEFMLERWEEIKRGIHKSFEIEVTARNGSKMNLLINSAPIRGTDRFLLVHRDITDFKNLEKRFYESQKLAAVGQLSVGVAHEVRNALSSIKMSIQILEKRLNPVDNDLKRFKIVEKEVGRMEKIVTDILLYAKPAKPEMRLMDINTLLDNSLFLTEKELAEKRIDVQFDRDTEIYPIPLDAVMLEQAFLNLFLNAIDAMDIGGRLRLKTRFIKEDNRKHVLIAIEDNGCGIDEEDMPHLFNPFFTRKRYGTGLGLTQVQTFIELHQGAIEIFSKKNEGTRVVITLPAAEEKMKPELPVNHTEGQRHGEDSHY